MLDKHHHVQSRMGSVVFRLPIVDLYFTATAVWRSRNPARASCCVYDHDSKVCVVFIILFPWWVFQQQTQHEDITGSVIVCSLINLL